MTRGGRPGLLLVGGGGGLLGRAVLEALRSRWTIRSVHRHPTALESALGIETIRSDISTEKDWPSRLDGIDAIVNLAWYRQARSERFRGLSEGLLRLIEAARRSSVSRFVHVSVPDAPEELERSLPYLLEKRRVDRALSESGLSYAIVRPTAMFAPGDVLLGVMMRTMRRYRMFPMFGDGSAHLSPIAAADVAEAIGLLLRRSTVGSIDLGGPVNYRLKELTGRMFTLLGQPPRYLRLSEAGSVRLARLLETFGSSLLYAYEVTWLLSDRLGLPPYEGLPHPLQRVEPYLEATAQRLRGPVATARSA